MFGRSATPYLGDEFGLKTTECAELTRVALRRHKTPVSKIVSIALRMIKKQSPGLKLIVSYADPNVGHVGGIYQAMNWVYMGGSSPITQWKYQGSWRNDTSLMRMFQKDKTLKHRLPFRKLAPKHKYLYPLDDDIKKTIETYRKPYPKLDVGKPRVG